MVQIVRDVWLTHLTHTKMALDLVDQRVIRILGDIGQSILWNSEIGTVIRLKGLVTFQVIDKTRIVHLDCLWRLEVTIPRSEQLA